MATEFMLDGNGNGIATAPVPVPAAAQPNVAPDGSMRLEDFLKKYPDAKPAVPPANDGLMRLDDAIAKHGPIQGQPQQSMLTPEQVFGTPSSPPAADGSMRLEDFLKLHPDAKPAAPTAGDASQYPRLEDALKQPNIGPGVSTLDLNGPSYGTKVGEDYIARIEGKHGPMDPQQKMNMLQQMRERYDNAQTANQMGQQVASKSAETNTPMQNFGMPIVQGEVQAGENLLHPLDPAARNAATQNVDQMTQTPAGSMAAKIGGATNFGMQLAPMLVPGVGQAYALEQGAANVANEAEAQREAGRKVSGWKEAGDMAVQAALAAASGPMAKGVGNLAKPALAKLLGEAAAPVLSRYLGTMSAGEVMQIGNNLADRVSGVDPDRHPLEGIGQAAIGGALAHGATELAGMHAPSPAPTELPGRAAETPAEQKTAPLPLGSTEGRGSDANVGSPLLDRVRAAQVAKEQSGANPAQPESQPQAKSALLERAKIAQTAQPITDADRQAYLSPGEALNDQNRADIDRAIQRVRIRDANNAPASAAEGAGGGAAGEQFAGARRGAVAIPGAAARPVEELGRLMSNSPNPETGRTPFQDRSGVQAATGGLVKSLKNARQSWNSVNRFLGTGLGETEQSKGTGERVAASLANVDRDRIQTEARLKPARDAMAGWSDKAKELWINQIEAGQPSPDKATQGAADLIRDQNADLAKRAAAVGMDTSKWNGDWIGRLAEWPDDKGNGNRSSLAGNEDYLKGRKLDTFSDFKTAVEATGGRLKYENPLDMYLAKNLEANRSITARELLKGEQGRGNVMDAPKQGKVPDGFKLLDDKIVRGKMAPAPVAEKLNQMIASGVAGRGVPILKQWVDFKRQSAAINFALSGWHATTSTLRNAGMQIGTAMESVANGEFGMAAKNLWRANPLAQRSFGKSLQEAAAAAKGVPGLEPLVKAAEEGGTRLGIKSFVTDRTPFQKAADAYKGGSGAAAGYHFLRGLAHASTNLIMDKYVAPIKVGIMGNIAELELAKGNADPDQLRSKMNAASSTVDNVMGMIVRDNQFQHRIATDVMDGLFAAPKFFEGDIRLAGQTTIDTGKAFWDMAHGKKPAMTRSMYTAAGLLVGHATASAIMQMAMTAYHNGGTPTPPQSLKDLFYPRTGGKNADGGDKRLTLPDLGFIPSEAAGVAKGHPFQPILNRIEPLLRAAADVASNSDYRNVQVREGDLGQQVEQSAKHIGKAFLPFTVENAVTRPSSDQSPGWAEKIGNWIGVQRAPASLSQSDAVQTAHDLIQQRGGNPVRTQEQEAKYNMEQTFTNRIRAELKNRNDRGVWNDLQDAVATGKFTEHEADELAKRAINAPGLPSLVTSPRLNADDVMAIWDKATPDERKQIWETVGKRVMEPSVPYLKSKQYLKRMHDDLQAAGAIPAAPPPAPPKAAADGSMSIAEFLKQGQASAAPAASQ